MFLEAFTRLLETHCSPALVRAARIDPAAVGPLRKALSDSGFLDILRPEDQGGANLPLPDFAPLAMAAGHALLPISFAEPAVERLTGAALSAEAAAALDSARMAGACRRLFEMTVDHVTTRTQFGRPLGAFQAVQHQMAVMAEELAAAMLAAHMGLRGPGFTADRSAIAKIRCTEAAELIATTVHQLHGAIGATEDHDLQLWTTELRRLQRSSGTAATHALALGTARAATGAASLPFLQRILS